MYYSYLGISKPTLYVYLEHLETAGLVAGLKTEGTGATLTRRHGKLLLDNTNLLFAIGRPVLQKRLACATQSTP